jgi:hypothetical protein
MKNHWLQITHWLSNIQWLEALSTSQQQGQADASRRQIINSVSTTGYN